MLVTPPPPPPPVVARAELGHGWIVTAGVFSTAATLISFATTLLHLRHYRRPNAQRFVVRIIGMVPIYAISSWISLVSLNAAFYVDAIRDIYEAFVVYCFFNLLVTFLGGERELLFKLHTRPPVEYIWPVRLWIKEMDASSTCGAGDPYTFLSIKRGILQFVYIKPILAVLTMVLKLFDAFKDGDLSLDSGYFWITVVYNVTFSWCLYCLSMFFLATRHDLEPFRAVPKFLCIKAIIFFSFWQGVGISLLVKIGIIHSTAELFTADNIAVAMQDFLICLEMVPAAMGHWSAFSYRDYTGPDLAGRMPMFYALRDAFGYKDVWQDTVTTVSGSEFNYRTFEPADGVAASWQKRINTGLRYSQGGRNKYWIAHKYDSPRAGQYTGESSHQAMPVALTPQDWADPEASGMLGFQEATWDVEAERAYTEAREMIYGDVNCPVLPVTRRPRHIGHVEAGGSGGGGGGGGRYGTGNHAARREASSASSASMRPPRPKRKHKRKTQSSSDPTMPLIVDDSYVRH
ncbi:organic solute transporter Ostalpha-domain-containing protein [Syncephalis pseudoplumigaleata]|uniref:Organic solute transporter Ostalpha-domain-containing protein n=1 Tax=Syncephalis pseudoplumigaleata TaxID=1712513 RepID=A0A4P9Z0A1_9FUNG|nr:organic solute transporter Ostalpha-domain-containing protein [Syncephalis pseudoplumigaleata]|eukprot:RKP25883.1 organic solute transporter Ostalpha-domain-containing protein [Syncephalis pseudoplumigaleata]